MKRTCLTRALDALAAGDGGGGVGAVAIFGPDHPSIFRWRGWMSRVPAARRSDTLPRGVLMAGAILPEYGDVAGLRLCPDLEAGAGPS